MIKEKKKKLKYYEITSENDIAYKGKLSYRYIKIIGWFFLAVACYSTILGMYSAIGNEKYQTASDVLSFAKDLSVSLMLIGGFATILSGRGNYKRVIINNSAIAFGIILLFVFGYFRYIRPAGEALLGDKKLVLAALRDMFSQDNSPGYYSFNIFIDLTLCTLVLFFVNYTPKTHFQGKKIYLFRSLIILPILYEAASMTLIMLAALHKIKLSVFVFPFLTTKPPLSFLLFISIARYFKSTKQGFLKNGKTEEDYQAYLDTNHNSFRFSKYLCKRILIYAVLDILLSIIAEIMLILSMSVDTADEAAFSRVNDIVVNMGFGNTAALLLIIPVLLLFSYTKTHKNIIIDIAIPVIGVAVIVFLYIDGLFQLACDFLKGMSSAAAGGV